MNKIEQLITAIQFNDLDECDNLFNSSSFTREELQLVEEKTKTEDIFSFSGFVQDNTFLIAKAIENGNGDLENLIYEFLIS